MGHLAREHQWRTLLFPFFFFFFLDLAMIFSGRCGAATVMSVQASLLPW